MYEIKIRKTAIRQLSKLPPKEALWIAKQLKSLSENPRPQACKKLKGFKNYFRIRIGDYRAIYIIDDKVLLVEIVRIGNRKEVYI